MSASLWKGYSTYGAEHHTAPGHDQVLMKIRVPAGTVIYPLDGKFGWFPFPEHEVPFGPRSHFEIRGVHAKDLGGGAEAVDSRRCVGSHGEVR